VQALLLGSGISRSAGIPTGWEITVDLIRRLGRAREAGDQADWPAWYQSTFNRAPSYSEILDAVASTPAERRAVIQGYIEPVEGEEGRRPSKAHEAIAKLVAAGAIRVIVTTNFDRLLEAALRDIGVEPVVIASDDAIVGATPLVHSRCTIIKLHGDYMDARIKNTEDELETYSSSMSTLLDRVLDEFGLVVCGWSGDWDTALKAAIMRTPSRRYPFYWMSRGEPTTLGADVIVHRQGRIVRAADADTFFMRVLAKLEALRGDSPHPQSVAMTVAQGKLQCRDDQNAPDWSDLLAVEVEKVLTFLTGPDYPTDHPTNESINDLIETMVTRSEALRRLVLIGTRWGGPEAFRAVLRAIAAIADPAANNSGFTYWISLRLVPASLCFYWAVAGAVMREDFARLAALMHLQIPTRQENRRAAIATLPLLALDSIEWRVLKGFERAHTPHSSHFHPIFATDARDVVVSSHEADEAWDAAEFWIAMEFAAVRLPEYQANKSWFWTPAGRFIWRRQGMSMSERIAAMRELNADAPAFKAGLLGGSPERAKEIIDAAAEFLGKVGSGFF
jgi:hypothetical protein